MNAVTPGDRKEEEGKSNYIRGRRRSIQLHPGREKGREKVSLVTYGREKGRKRSVFTSGEGKGESSYIRGKKRGLVTSGQRKSESSYIWAHHTWRKTGAMRPSAVGPTLIRQLPP